MTHNGKYIERREGFVMSLTRLVFAILIGFMAIPLSANQDTKRRNQKKEKATS